MLEGRCLRNTGMPADQTGRGHLVLHLAFGRSLGRREDCTSRVRGVPRACWDSRNPQCVVVWNHPPDLLLRMAQLHENDFTCREAKSEQSANHVFQELSIPAGAHTQGLPHQPCHILLPGARLSLPSPLAPEGTQAPQPPTQRKEVPLASVPGAASLPHKARPPAGCLLCRLWRVLIHLFWDMNAMGGMHTEDSSNK